MRYNITPAGSADAAPERMAGYTTHPPYGSSAPALNFVVCKICIRAFRIMPIFRCELSEFASRQWWSRLTACRAHSLSAEDVLDADAKLIHQSRCKLVTGNNCMLPCRILIRGCEQCVFFRPYCSHW